MHEQDRLGGLLLGDCAYCACRHSAFTSGDPAKNACLSCAQRFGIPISELPALGQYIDHSYMALELVARALRKLALYMDPPEGWSQKDSVKLLQMHGRLIKEAGKDGSIALPPPIEDAEELLEKLQQGPAVQNPETFMTFRAVIQLYHQGALWSVSHIDRLLFKYWIQERHSQGYGLPDELVCQCDPAHLKEGPSYGA